MKIITFANNKGGVLKTSLTVNYGCVLAKKGYKVLIVDTDSQCNVLHSFSKNLNAKDVDISLYDVIFRSKDVKKAIYNVFENIDIINAGLELREFDTLVTKNFIYGESFRHIKDIINEIKNNFNYDYVLIDTEPKKSACTFDVLLASENIIIPFTLESFGIQALVEMYSYIMQAKKVNENLNVIGLVATKTSARSKTEKLILEQQQKLPSPGLCEISIPHSTTSASSTTLKKLPVYLTSKNKLTKAYDSLVELLEFKNKSL